MSILFFSTPKTSLFLGLYVEMNGITYIFSAGFSVSKISRGTERAFKIPCLMTDLGYILCKGIVQTHLGVSVSVYDRRQ